MKSPQSWRGAPEPRPVNHNAAYAFLVFAACGAVFIIGYLAVIFAEAIR